MSLLRSVIVSLAVVGVAMALGAGLYESVVMAPNYRAHIPESIVTARNFMSVTHPGMYFRVLAPLTQLLLLLSVILHWRLRKVRWWLAAALVLMLLTDVITFKFHYPRNAVLFQNSLEGVPVDVLETAARQWASGNYVRIVLIASAAACGLRGLRQAWKAST